MTAASDHAGHMKNCGNRNTSRRQIPRASDDNRHGAGASDAPRKVAWNGITGSIGAMNPAPNLVLVGPMGAGKSSIGRRLAERLGLTFLDADHEIEARTGATVTTIFACEGEPGFRVRERAALAELLAHDGCVIATGGGAVLDPENRRLLRERSYVVHLHVDLQQQAARLARDRTRPLLAGEDRDAVLQRLAETREPLYREIADLRFDTNLQAPAEAAARLGHLLETCWQRDGLESASTSFATRAAPNAWGST